MEFAHTHTCGCASCADSYNPYERHFVKQRGSEEEDDEEEEFCTTISDDDKTLLQVELTILLDELDKEIQLSSACFLEPSLVYGLPLFYRGLLVKLHTYSQWMIIIIDRCSISKYSTILKLVEISLKNLEI